jgi:hypothetical protein
MSTADDRYREKMAARAEKRAPAIPAPVVVPAGASVGDRYLAKLAARRAGVQTTQEPDPKPEPKAAKAKGEDTKPTDPAAKK